jgi:hypothetical protein
MVFNATFNNISVIWWWSVGRCRKDKRIVLTNNAKIWKWPFKSYVFQSYLADTGHPVSKKINLCDIFFIKN